MHRATQWAATVAVLFTYSAVSAVVYALWSRFVGWGVYSSEALMRCVHLLPSVVLAAILGVALSRISQHVGRVAIACLMAAYVGISHVISYNGIFSSGLGGEYFLAAIVEAAILILVSEAAYVLTDRRLSVVST